MTTETHIELILAALGADATQRLVETLGGERHRIPKTPRPWLIDKIGADAAAKLCQLYGDTDLSIPMAKARKRHERDRLIRADFDAGASVHQLVRKYELHESRIRAILNGVDEAIPTGAARIGGLSQLRDKATIDLFNQGETG